MKLNDKDDRNKTHRCLMITREKRSAWVLFIDNVKTINSTLTFLKKKDETGQQTRRKRKILSC